MDQVLFVNYRETISNAFSPSFNVIQGICATEMLPLHVDILAEWEGWAESC